MLSVNYKELLLTTITIVLLSGSFVNGFENNNIENNGVMALENDTKQNIKDNKVGKYKHFNINVSLGTPYLYNIGVKYRVTEKFYFGTQVPLLPVCHLYIPEGMALEMGITSTNYLKNKRV